MKFRTNIEMIPSEFKVCHENKIMMLGSCFTDNIGGKLLSLKFDALVNPFGVLYNPASIEKQMRNLICDKSPQEKDLKQNGSKNFHLMFHSSFSNSDKNMAIKEMQNAFSLAKKQLQNLDILFITWGTSRVYRFVESDEIVANCHKLPARNFNRETLSSQDISDSYSDLFAEILKIRPNLKIVLTVSPIRHLKDGFIENQRSKSRLILAAEKLTEKFKQVYYFPSYEILMDDLRDYRFYADDMVHPSDTAKKYIWNAFSECFFSKETLDLNNKINKLQQAFSHRLFSPESDETKMFAKANLMFIASLEKQYPYLSLKEEKDYFEKILVL
jgi:hypothetical protein